MKRNFITTVLADSMFQKCKALGCAVSISAARLEELSGIEDFIPALTNEALIEALQAQGLNVWADRVKIELMPGDTLYVVNPGVKMHELESGESLPKHAVITVTKYEVTEDKQ